MISIGILGVSLHEALFIHNILAIELLFSRIGFKLLRNSSMAIANNKYQEVIGVEIELRVLVEFLISFQNSAHCGHQFLLSLIIHSNAHC